MNLDNLNLVELNAQEVQETAGGWRIGLSFFGFDVVSYDSGRPADSNWRTDLW
jgi:hypothetical protein